MFLTWFPLETLPSFRFSTIFSISSAALSKNDRSPAFTISGPDFITVLIIKKKEWNNVVICCKNKSFPRCVFEIKTFLQTLHPVTEPGCEDSWRWLWRQFLRPHKWRVFYEWIDLYGWVPGWVRTAHNYTQLQWLTRNVRTSCGWNKDTSQRHSSTEGATPYQRERLCVSPVPPFYRRY